MDPNLIMVLAGLGAYLATMVIKYVFPKIPQVIIPWIITPLLGLLGGWVTTLMGGDLFWQVALGTLLSSFANGLVSQTRNVIDGTSKTVKEAAIVKAAEVAKVAPFLAILLLGASFLSPLVATAQIGESAPEITAYEAKELFEPDYTIGLITVKNNPSGEGIVTRLTPGIGIGIAYSSVTSSDGENWDITVWSVALDPLYIERDESGALFWVPGIKGTVFNEYLQVYLGYKIGSMTKSDASRFEVKFGTSITGIWDGLTEVAGL